MLVDLGPPIGEVWVHSPEDLILYKLRYFRSPLFPGETSSGSTVTSPLFGRFSRMTLHS